MKKQVHVFIYGDVIGVGFRAWTMRNARVLGLSGWVRNVGERSFPAKDRVVEAVFCGEEDNIKEMLGLCREGPETGWIERVDVSWDKKTGDFEGFSIKH